MNILDQFEQGCERLLEGGIGRVFRSPIQPAEIGRKLERAMSANQVVSVDATLVPNDYRVGMHPRDMLLFVAYLSALCRQLENWLVEMADERGYTLVDRVQVRIVDDERVPRRSIRVTAAIAEWPGLGQAAPDEVERTEVFRVIRATGGARPARLRFLGGPRRDEEVLIGQPVTTVGRALDNDVVLDGGDVSRHHARFEAAAGELRIVDLGSTNGTRVNGQAVTRKRVRPGDEVSFGTFRVRVLPFGSDGAS